MRGLAASLLLLAMIAAGCVPAPREAARGRPPDAARTAMFDAALLEAATQVRRCYRSPRVSSAGRQIVTRLRVRLSADGRVSGLPAVVVQDGVTPANQLYADRMAEAAIGAVMRCAPLRLPPGVYVDGRTEFELTFSPVARG